MASLKQRKNRADELVNDMELVGSLLSKAEDEQVRKALDLLHLLIMKAFQRVSGH